MQLKLPKINLKKKEKRIVINPGEVEIKESKEEQTKEGQKYKHNISQNCSTIMFFLIFLKIP